MHSEHVPPGLTESLAALFVRVWVCACCRQRRKMSEGIVRLKVVLSGDTDTTDLRQKMLEGFRAHSHAGLGWNTTGSASKCELKFMGRRVEFGMDSATTPSDLAHRHSTNIVVIVMRPTDNESALEYSCAAQVVYARSSLVNAHIMVLCHKPSAAEAEVKAGELPVLSRTTANLLAPFELKNMLNRLCAAALQHTYRQFVDCKVAETLPVRGEVRAHLTGFTDALEVQLKDLTPAAEGSEPRILRVVAPLLAPVDIDLCALGDPASVRLGLTGSGLSATEVIDSKLSLFASGDGTAYLEVEREYKSLADAQAERTSVAASNKELELSLAAVRADNEALRAQVAALTSEAQQQSIRLLASEEKGDVVQRASHAQHAETVRLTAANENPGSEIQAAQMARTEREQFHEQIKLLKQELAQKDQEIALLQAQQESGSQLWPVSTLPVAPRARTPTMELATDLASYQGIVLQPLVAAHTLEITKQHDTIRDLEKRVADLTTQLDEQKQLQDFQRRSLRERAENGMKIQRKTIDWQKDIIGKIRGAQTRPDPAFRDRVITLSERPMPEDIAQGLNIDATYLSTEPSDGWSGFNWLNWIASVPGVSAFLSRHRPSVATTVAANPALPPAETLLALEYPARADSTSVSDVQPSPPPPNSSLD
eukprot:m.435687 g.435687  ORF g.435687 m.435687 type:complete len:654 (-) comp56763_c0_seq71:93-2054(-)